jgi:type IV pilus assembly protein PilE
MAGVTLVELLTVIVIVAILSSIAVGSYRRYMLRSNRTDATGLLLRIQVAEEKYYLQNNSYTDLLGSDGLGLLSTATTKSMTSPNGYYSVSIAADTATSATNTLANSFIATATPQNGQTQDTTCTSLTINDQGVHGSSPSAASTCWR